MDVEEGEQCRYQIGMPIVANSFADLLSKIQSKFLLILLHLIRLSLILIW